MNPRPNKPSLGPSDTAPASVDPPEELEPPFRSRCFGEYVATRMLGSGGMGKVYEAIHVRIGHRVAIKTLHAQRQREPQAIKRLLREGQLLTRLRHPGVVRVLHCDQSEPDGLYLVMELLEGRSLREYLQDPHRGYRVPELIEIIWQVAEAMAYVHSQQVLHRDLKPENILLLTRQAAPGSSEQLVVKVIDFGIAKAPAKAVRGSRTEAQLDTILETRERALLGTELYMAPEQCLGHSITDRTDVYALGIVLFELLSGRPPFLAPDPTSAMRQHVHETAPMLGAPVGADLAALVAMMLNKTPALRPDMRTVAIILGQATNPSTRCPFAGAGSFDASRADTYCGREAALDKLVRLVLAARNSDVRWVQLAGANGSGKTSLVEAGLASRLTAGESASGASWKVITTRPAALARATQALTQEIGSSATSVSTLLVLDPFEELLERIDHDTPAFKEAMAVISRLITKPGGNLVLLTAVRTESAEQCVRLGPLLELWPGARRLDLEHPSPEELHLMASEPARRAGLLIEPGLIERLTADAAETRSPLTYLSFALERLWKKRTGFLLTQASYAELGRLHGALGKLADQVLGGLTHEERALAKWMLLDQVRVGRGSADSRRLRSASIVLAASGGGTLAERTLRHLAGSEELSAAGRLIVVHRSTVYPDITLIIMQS